MNKEVKEEKVMAAIIANPGSDNKKLVTKTGLGREAVRLTVKDLLAKGKVIANTSGKAITFIAKEKKTTSKAVVKNSAKTAKPAAKSSADNDRTKVMFAGQELTKGKFVLAVIQAEVQKNPNITFAELQAKYPNNTHRKYGVIQPLKEAIKKCQKQKRFFIREDQVVKLKDGDVAVCSDWGTGNIGNFERRAKQNGHTFSYAK